MLAFFYKRKYTARFVERELPSIFKLKFGNQDKYYSAYHFGRNYRHYHTKQKIILKSIKFMTWLEIKSHTNCCCNTNMNRLSVKNNKYIIYTDTFAVIKPVKLLSAVLKMRVTTIVK